MSFFCCLWISTRAAFLKTKTLGNVLPSIGQQCTDSSSQVIARGIGACRQTAGSETAERGLKNEGDVVSM